MPLRIQLKSPNPDRGSVETDAVVSSATLATSKPHSRLGRGFTLTELLIVLAITVVLAAMAAFQIVAALRQAHISTAVETTVRELRSARERAIDTRTEYVVTFQVPGRIQTQSIAAGVLGPATFIDLPSDERFVIVPGVPTVPKTPDGFGSGTTAIDFDLGNGGGGNVLFFYPDGTVLDAAGNLNNGVLYMARPGDLSSSRAITIWGATGRVKVWRLAGKAGAAQWL